jgi:hypothetical protein
VAEKGENRCKPDWKNPVFADNRQMVLAVPVQQLFTASSNIHMLFSCIPSRPYAGTISTGRILELPGMSRAILQNESALWCTVFQVA